MNQPNLLAQLHDLHQPTPVSWWPPAPGWFILFVLVIGGCFILGRLAYKTWRRAKRKRYALQQLARLQQSYMQTQDCADIAKVAVLLKQVVMTRYSRKQVASMTGPTWLKFLDTISKTDQYTQGVGICLTELPYQKTAEPVNDLFPLIEKTFKRCL